MSGTTGIKISDATPAAPLQGTDLMPIARSGTTMPYNAQMNDVVTYVTTLASNTTPLVDGTASPGSMTQYARADHVHPGSGGSAGVSSFNGRLGAVTLSLADVTGAGGAPLASPAFTGTPSLPTGAAGVTQPPGNNTAALATTAFVQSAVTVGAAGVASFNARTGAVTLQAADVTGVGGALASSVPAASNATPTMAGTAAPGTATTFSRADHVHPTDTSRYAASNPSNFQTAAQVNAVVPAPSSTTPAMDGTGAPGTSSAYARADHVHPLAAGSGGAVVSDTAPLTPTNGELWFDSVGAQLYVSYADPNSQEWVAASSQGAGLPDSPADGQVYGRTVGTWAPIAPSAPPGAVYNVGRNYVHNGLFSIQQRGVGAFAANTAGVYGPDRWIVATGAAGDTYNAQLAAHSDGNRAAIGDEAAEWFLTNAFTGGTGASNICVLLQRIEDVYRLSGQTVTISFWANSGAALKLGVTLGQNFGSGGSATVNAPSQAVTLSSTWTRYSVTIALPSIAGKTVGTGNFTNLQFAFSGPNSSVGAAQSGTINIWGVQLEVGGGAGYPTQLEKRDPMLEKALCQRFFQFGQIITSGYAAVAAQTIFWSSVLAVAMRGAPTIVVTPQTTGNCGTFTGGQYLNSTVWLQAQATAVGVFSAGASFTASADL
jgi:hypothetical protein